MARVGRNEPCPCGSGKKFKQCCARAAAVPGMSAWHEVERRIEEQLGKFAGKRAHEGFQPWDSFPYEPIDADLGLVIPYTLYELRFDGERRVADVFLDERGPNLSVRERAWLVANTRSWFSVWQVTKVAPGEGLTLVDRLTGAERTVHEVSASRELRVGHCVLARVVDVEGVSVLGGIHHRLLAPEQGTTFVEEARRALRVRKRLVPVSRLREAGAPELLIAAWQRFIDVLDDQPLPQLCNTDGDPLLQTTDHYGVDPRAHDAVVSALSSLEPVERAQDGDTLVFTLLRGRNLMHPEWENTISGTARLDGAKLTVETNSVDRAGDVRELIEDALAKAGLSKAVQYRTRVHEDLMVKVTERLVSGKLPPEREISVEEAQLVRDVKEAHYRAWLDQPLPALGGKTPRVAAKSAKLRAKVGDILLSIEHMEAALPSAARFDVASVRRALGL